jgi:DNA-binding IclR family transcriptional regulator
MEVLEAFRRTRRPLSATEVCRELGYPKSSANALLKSLVRLGYVSLDDKSFTYFPTMKVSRLGDWIKDELCVTTRSILNRLHSDTGETIILTKKNDVHMQTIVSIPGTFPITFKLDEGYMAPLFGSAVGTAVLATFDDDRIERLWRRAKPIEGAVAKPLSFAELSTEINHARELGYAVAYDQLVPDSGTVAMLVPTADEADSDVAVCVSGLASRIRREERRIVKKMSSIIPEISAMSG